MEAENINGKAINDAYKNAHIALQSISDVLPSVDDAELKKELLDEYEGYEKLIGEISGFMSEQKIQPKDIGPIKKAVIWSSIKMKTLVDDSRNKLADMLIKGTVMGINELKAMENEKENYDENVAEFISKLLKLEESYVEKLKTFL